MKALIARVLTLTMFASATAATQQRPTSTTTGISITRRADPSPAAARPTPATGASSASTSTMTGVVRVVPVFQATGAGRAYGSDVTFEPGARTAWHSHPAGQTLIVTSGLGRVQQWGAPIDEIRAGDVVQIPPNVKHWHGASPDAGMSHLAIGEPIDGRAVEWMEPVSEAQYQSPVRTPTPPARARAPRTPVDTTGRSVAPRAMTEFAPQLADLTDRILYGEVWPDEGLSQRDRSLVTVSALVALNRPDQLRSHVGRARANGVTKEEMAALITHLAFYAGWPSAVTAVGIANEVYQGR